MIDYIDKVKNIDMNNITEKELEQFLPSLGMNNEIMHEMPQELGIYCGKGLKFWQYPNQFSKYLKHISKYNNINSYLEIGCRWGGTFIITSEILKLKNNNIDLYACDIIDMPEQLIIYSNQQKFTYFSQGSENLKKEEFKSGIDLILIDGLHTYDAVKRDYEFCLSLSPKYIVFHDIYSDACPGVVKLWDQIKTKYPYYEFVDQYETVKGKFLGIGLIEL